jgi:predicted ribosome quality control (RQC) complex YloA/Tae2 family protein
MVYTEIITAAPAHTWTIKIGRNEKENVTLIRNRNKNDLWFHLEDNPSPHGFIGSNVGSNTGSNVGSNTGSNVGSNASFTPAPNAEPPHELIYKTALLVKKYSNCKHIPSVSVIYTKIENVCLTKKLGTVIIKKKTNKINV